MWLQACDPREFLLFLPRLADLLMQAGLYVAQQEVAGRMQQLLLQEDVELASALGEPQSASPCAAAAAASQDAYADTLEHFAGQAVLAFAALPRRNAAFCADTLHFLGQLGGAYVRFCALPQPCNCPCSLTACSAPTLRATALPSSLSWAAQRLF
jgi:hypothetical protein